MSDNLEKLESLLSLSKQMLQEAAQDNWEQVDCLEKLRQAHLPDFSEEEFSASEFVDIENKLQELSEINSTLLNLGENAREHHREDNRRFAKGKRAVSAYSNNF